MKTSSAIALAFGLFAMSSCSDDRTEDLPKSDNIKTYEFLNAKSYSDWVYFSFDKGDIVQVTDHQNDISWDIAFHRNNIRLNGGKSGRGKGEAINTKQTQWSSVSSVPHTGYTKDDIGRIVISYTRTGPTYEDQSFSQVMNDWVTVDTSNPPPKYTVNNWIYVVKTATGKPVKIQMYDNKNQQGTLAGYVSFRYQYNPTGSTKF